jgi:hypothetical protein
MQALPRVQGAETEHPAPRQRGLSALIKAALVVPERPNEVWSADFMSDALWSGRRFRTFNVMDDFNRDLSASKSRRAFRHRESCGHLIN